MERLLATVANNVNQLARHANTTGELPAAVKLEEARSEVLELVWQQREVTGECPFDSLLMRRSFHIRIPSEALGPAR